MTTLRGIVPDQKYVVNFIFLQEPFKIGQPYITNMVLQDLQRKLKIRSYSKQFKIEIIEKYIRGEASSIELGNQYDISSSLLRRWIQMYNANIELKDYYPKQEVYMAEARRKTTKEERKKIVEYCLNNNRDYKDTAAKFDVSYSQVYNWVRKYDACGLEGFDRQKRSS